MNSFLYLVVFLANVLLLYYTYTRIDEVGSSFVNNELGLLLSKNNSIIITNDCKYITPRISTDTNNLNNKLPYSTKEALRIQQPFSSSVSQTTPLPQDVLEFDVMVSNEEKAKCDSCIFINDNNEYSFSQKDSFERAKENPSFSIISTCTPERLDFIPFFLKRWPSYLVFAVQIKSNGKAEIIEIIKSLQLPNRVTVVLMITKDNCNKFYVNKLRNIAITSIRTTHFLVLDMDLWPLDNLYSEIQSLPESIIQSSNTAVILPSFFINANPILKNCSSLMDCALKSEARFPTSKKELTRCVTIRQCTARKLKGIQHLYVGPEWFDNNDHYLSMKCFKNRFQEPYLLLKYSKNMLLFDERFVDYGCNKVQYVDHLRLRGYQFYILTNTFAMDIVHHESSFRKSYMVYAMAGQAGAMRKLCDRYLAKTEYLYPNSTVVNICGDLYE